MWDAVVCIACLRGGEQQRAGWLSLCLCVSGCQVQRQRPCSWCHWSRIPWMGAVVELITSFVIGRHWGIGDKGGLSVVRHLCTEWECVAMCAHVSVCLFELDSNGCLLVCKAGALNISFQTPFGILPSVCTFVCCEPERSSYYTVHVGLNGWRCRGGAL